jgi:hypothetical protein
MAREQNHKDFCWLLLKSQMCVCVSTYIYIYMACSRTLGKYLSVFLIKLISFSFL